jgi:hypothetical protein
MWQTSLELFELYVKQNFCVRMHKVPKWAPVNVNSRLNCGGYAKQTAQCSRQSCGIAGQRDA